MPKKRKTPPPKTRRIAGYDVRVPSLNQIYTTLAIIALLAAGAAGLGYGAPWLSAQAGQSLDSREKQHFVTLQQQIQQTNQSVANLSQSVRDVDLNTRESLLLASKAQTDAALLHERRGSPSYQILYQQKLRTDAALRKMGVLP